MFRLTVKDLQAKNACITGIAAFERAFPNGIDVPTWTAWHQAVVLGSAELRPYLGWAVAVGLLPMWTLHRAGLSGADLSGAARCPSDPAVVGWTRDPETGRLSAVKE